MPIALVLLVALIHFSFHTPESPRLLTNHCWSGWLSRVPFTTSAQHPQRHLFKSMHYSCSLPSVCTASGERITDPNAHFRHVIYVCTASSLPSANLLTTSFVQEHRNGRNLQKSTLSILHAVLSSATWPTDCVAIYTIRSAGLQHIFSDIHLPPFVGFVLQFLPRIPKNSAIALVISSAPMLCKVTDPTNCIALFRFHRFCYFCSLSRFCLNRLPIYLIMNNFAILTIFQKLSITYRLKHYAHTRMTSPAEPFYLNQNTQLAFQSSLLKPVPKSFWKDQHYARQFFPSRIPVFQFISDIPELHSVSLWNELFFRKALFCNCVDTGRMRNINYLTTNWQIAISV